MQCFPPSKLAAAVIAASRCEQGLPMWTEQLKDLTDYTVDQIEEPVLLLMKR